MKKFLLSSFFSFLLLSFFWLVVDNVSAHPWRTAADWCHYCRTNCDSWGEAWNQRHCHNWSSSSYEDTYTPPAPEPEPSCTDLYGRASTELDNGECGCILWYEPGYDSSWDETCIKSLSCSEKHGPNAYQWSDGDCYCKDGYIADSEWISCIKEPTPQNNETTTDTTHNAQAVIVFELFKKRYSTLSPEQQKTKYTTILQILSKAKSQISDTQKLELVETLEVLIQQELAAISCDDEMVQLSCLLGLDDCPSECRE